LIYGDAHRPPDDDRRREIRDDAGLMQIDKLRLSDPDIELRRVSASVTNT
jgi:hypothetical protein